MKAGQTCGIVTLMFTGFESALSVLREKDDEANTVLAATATGYLYGSTRKIAILFFRRPQNQRLYSPLRGTIILVLYLAW